MFVLDQQGTVLEAPKQHPKQKPLKLSECAPLFMHAFDLRGAGACLHSHSVNVVMATLLDESSDEFVVTHQEMIKGIAGHRFDEALTIPIIENTPRECHLADLLASAIKAYPRSPAVMVRRHGIYVWGTDWKHAKTQAECIDYLCGWAVEMHRIGLNPATNPFLDPRLAGRIEAWYMDAAAEGVADQRRPMRCAPNRPASKAALEALGVEQWKFDADKFETDPRLAQLRRDKGYSYHDLITVSADRLPNYEAKIKTFYEEHLHTGLGLLEPLLVIKKKKTEESLPWRSSPCLLFGTSAP
jgi:methylthioribulose-1-phosphate dehydratase